MRNAFFFFFFFSKNSSNYTRRYTCHFRHSFSIHWYLLVYKTVCLLFCQRSNICKVNICWTFCCILFYTNHLYFIFTFRDCSYQSFSWLFRVLCDCLTNSWSSFDTKSWHVVKAWRHIESGVMHHDEDCDVWLTYAVDVRTPSNSASRTISPLLTSMPIISKTTSKGKQGFPPDRISTATSFSVFCGLVLCRNHPFSLSPTITLIFKISSAAML